MPINFQIANSLKTANENPKTKENNNNNIHDVFKSKSTRAKIHIKFFLQQILKPNKSISCIRTNAHINS